MIAQPVGAVPREGDVTLRAVLDHLDQTPQLIHDVNLVKLVDHYKGGPETLPVPRTAETYRRGRPVGPALAAMLCGKPA